MRISGWSKLSSCDLWRAWRDLFATQAEAESTAVWIANRLVKSAARSTRRRFYEVKEAFLRRYSDSLIDGQRVRVERRDCWDCDGSGDSGDGWCERCESTGIYSERTLYLHTLEIEGKRYSFHSYVEPRLLSNVSGEDIESYGGRFSDEELADLALPCSALVRMLRWVMMALWGASDRRPVAQPNCHCLAWPGRVTGGHHEYCRVGKIEEGVRI